MLLRAVLAFGLLLAVLLTGPSAEAQGQGIDPRDGAIPGAPPFERRVHLALDFHGAPTCNDAEMFQYIVRGQERRWDLWRPLSPWKVAVRVITHDGLFDAEGALWDTAGELRWARRFKNREKCFRVLLDVAAEVLGSIAVVEPRKATSEPASCAEASKLQCAEKKDDDLKHLVNWDPDKWPGPKGDPDPPKVPERLPFAIRFGASGWLELIADGWGSLGLSADLGVRWHYLSLNVEARGVPPIGSKVFAHEGAVSFARLSGALVGCAHVEWFVACGIADAGRFVFPNHLPALPSSALSVAINFRAGVEIPIPKTQRARFLRAAVEVGAPIRPLSYTGMHSNTTLFEPAGLSFGFGLSALFEVAPSKAQGPASPASADPPSQPGGKGPASTTVGQLFQGPQGS